MSLTLPFPDLVFVPLDILTAEEQNEIVANYTYISNQFPVTTANIGANAVTAAKMNFTTMKVCLPDYANQKSTNVWASGTSYTATERTFVRFYLNFFKNGSAPDVSVYINNKMVQRSQPDVAPTSTGNRLGLLNGIYHLAPGDTIRVTGSSGTQWNTKSAYLIPERWI